MPFKSKAQRRFLFAKHPEIAKRWAKEYGTPKKLPEKVNDEESDQKQARLTEDHMDIHQQIIEAMQMAGTAMTKNAEFRAKVQAAEKTAQSKIPDVVEALVASGSIEPHERDDAAKALNSHANTLELLKRASMRKTAAEELSLGKVAAAPAEKKAAYQGPIGSRSNGDRESDRVWEEAFGNLS